MTKGMLLTRGSSRIGSANADVIVGFQSVVTSIPVLSPSRPYLQAGVKRETVVMQEE